jgi:hypothetical protein
MPDELRLPDALAACEAHLAAQPLSPPRLDRDELLYRAGWAAAEAKLASPIPPPSKGGVSGRIGSENENGRGTIAAWSLASAALAASLAVAITLRVQSYGQSSRLIHTQPAQSAVSARAADSALPVRRADFHNPLLARLDVLLSESLAYHRLTAMPLLARSDAASWGVLDQSLALATVDGDSEAVDADLTAVSARELLEEMLPSTERKHSAGSLTPVTLPWSWGAAKSGGDAI